MSVRKFTRTARALVTPPVISGDVLEVDLPRTPSELIMRRRKLPAGSSLDASSVNTLVCAALGVLDEQLTDEQRYLAEQIYDLCNSLEATL